jgi:hypothetical protein
MAETSEDRNSPVYYTGDRGMKREIRGMRQRTLLMH